MVQSKINDQLTEEYICTAKENQKFDRKSAKIDVKDLANQIAGFANADGGVIVIGVTDDGRLEGFENYATKENDFSKNTVQYLKTLPDIKFEKLDIINTNGNEDFILLLHIEISHNSLIRNIKDEVYLRRGDSTIKLTDEQIQVLKVDRPEISYEDQPVLESNLDDIDKEMAEFYCEKIGAKGKNYIDVLRARRFITKVKDKECLTIAGVLLFAEDPTIFFPSARVRVIKYEGTYMKTGANLNIIKEQTFRLPLYKLIIEVQKFVGTQLRDFNHLNQNGIFETIPEYPEFAWQEGITNAVTHRNYAMKGEHTKIFIFDDRMEIRSPGKLPGLVTLENMKNVRYARNIKISETLLACGLVKELNEGVSRIYAEMANFFLEEPEYSLTEGEILVLTLRNNVLMRDKRETETLQKELKLEDKWKEFSDFERKVIKFISDKGEVSATDIMDYTSRSRNTVLNTLKKFETLQLIEWIGTSSRDPKRKYKIL